MKRKSVIILSLKIPPHLKSVATLPREMSGVLKATIENKTTSVKHFKEINNRKQRVNCHVLQFLHQMFNVSALLLDDTLKPATNGAINETLRHTLDISQGIV